MTKRFADNVGRGTREKAFSRAQAEKSDAGRSRFMTMRDEFKDSVRRATADPMYAHYVEARDAALAMLDNKPRDVLAEPSNYWREELAGLEYLFDASPLLVRNLRHHGYHFTGVRDWEYRGHHAYHATNFKKSLDALRAQDTRGLIVPESPVCGGFGYRIDGALYNADTLRFANAMIRLNELYDLDQFREQGTGKMVAEIGAGGGGFAYQFKTLFPGITYLIVDFPSAILFSATYLKAAFPDARVTFLTGRSGMLEDPLQYDFIFAPHYLWSRLDFARPDLLVNIASFQEMRTDQVEAYIKRAKEWGIPHIYSVNHDRNYGNPEIGAVGDVLYAHYAVEERNDVSGRSLMPILKHMYRDIKDIAKVVLRRKTKASKRYLFCRQP